MNGPWELRTTATGWSIRSNENGALFGSGRWDDMSMADDDPYIFISAHADAKQTEFYAVLPNSAEDALVTDLTSGEKCGTNAITFGPRGWTMFTWTGTPPDAKGEIHRFQVSFTDPTNKQRREVVFG